jgi:hypothetical protein
MTSMTHRSRLRMHPHLHAILWPSLAAGCLAAGGCAVWLQRRRRRRRQLLLAQMAAGPLQAAAGGGGGSSAVGPLGALAVGGLFGTTLQQRGARGSGAAGQGRGWSVGGGDGGAAVAAAAAAAAPEAQGQPGWFYGDGFMQQPGGGAAGDLGRISSSSTDGRRQHGSVWQLWQRLLSSNIRFVIRERRDDAAAGDSSSISGSDGCSSSSSPVGGCSPVPGATMDDAGRGTDAVRVRVIVDGGAEVVPGSGSRGGQRDDWGLREESYAARLHAAKQPPPR